MTLSTPRNASTLLPIALSAAALLSLTGAAAATDATSAGPASLTVYNGGFAVVREPLTLSLNAGETTVAYSGVTGMLEATSVILRDPAGRTRFDIVEQNYRNDPATQERMLSLFEGKTIDFLLDDGEAVKGRIIRSGYAPQFSNYRSGYPNPGALSPIIEVDGKLRFSLPGQPLFPALDDTSVILKPTLEWVINAPAKSSTNAQLAYITGGMGWNADYNIVESDDGNSLAISGWVTVTNATDSLFEGANLSLMAGDVNKIQPQEMQQYAARTMEMDGGSGGGVTERSLDEYHLYTIERPTTIRPMQTKQVEFVTADKVKSTKLFVYDGAAIDSGQYRYWSREQRRDNPDFGVNGQPKVWILREFENTKANGLGIPIPAGRVRFYQEDSEPRGKDTTLQFLGENTIEHTPKDETIRVYTGNAFDIVGERTRTNITRDQRAKQMTESFTIELRNRKDEPVEVRVVEHLYRWSDWNITGPTMPFTKTDSETIEFVVKLKANETKSVSYTANYSW